MPPSARSTARSDSGSLPTTRASRTVPSEKATSARTAPSTTWALVSRCESVEITEALPAPAPRAERTDTDATDGSVASAIRTTARTSTRPAHPLRPCDHLSTATALRGRVRGERTPPGQPAAGDVPYPDTALPRRPIAWRLRARGRRLSAWARIGVGGCCTSTSTSSSPPSRCCGIRSSRASRSSSAAAAIRPSARWSRRRRTRRASSASAPGCRCASPRGRRPMR